MPLPGVCHAAGSAGRQPPSHARTLHLILLIHCQPCPSRCLPLQAQPDGNHTAMRVPYTYVYTYIASHAPPNASRCRGIASHAPPNASRCQPCHLEPSRRCALPYRPAKSGAARPPYGADSRGRHAIQPCDLPILEVRAAIAPRQIRRRAVARAQRVRNRPPRKQLLVEGLARGGIWFMQDASNNM